MTADSRIKGVAILAFAGLLLAVVVLFLFYGISEPSSRSNTFTFTAWFSTGQVILLFAGLIYTAIKDGHPGSLIPVNSATVLVAFIYNVVAVVTMLLFTRFLLPDRSNARTYYVICIAELGAAVVYVALLQLVAVAHQVGHSEAVRSRATIDGLIKMCDAISCNAAGVGWKLDLQRCSEHIRFSEALRRDPALQPEVARLLAQIEASTNVPPEESTIGEVKKLISGIDALAQRRS